VPRNANVRCQHCHEGPERVLDGAKFVNVSGNRKAERIFYREAHNRSRLAIPAKFSVKILKRAGEGALAAMTSIAEAKNASRLALFQEVTMSAFV
jgi:hypothetical protein